jgi:hypothetical protein
MIRAAGVIEGHVGKRDSLDGGGGGVFDDLGGGWRGMGWVEAWLEALIGVGTNANAIVTPVP